MKTIERVLGGQTVELVTNNSFEVSLEENAPEILGILKAKEVEKWNAHGCAIVKDDNGMSIVCKPGLFGASRSQNASSDGPRISSKNPEVLESYLDEILGRKDISKEMRTWAQEIKDRWTEIHKKEEETRQKKLESLKKLSEGLSKEDIMALLGL